MNRNDPVTVHAAPRAWSAPSRTPAPEARGDVDRVADGQTLLNLPRPRPRIVRCTMRSSRRKEPPPIFAEARRGLHVAQLTAIQARRMPR